MFHGGLLLQPLGQRQGIAAVGLHAQTQSLQALEKDPCVERTHGRPCRAQKTVYAAPHQLLAADHGAADTAPLAIDVFCGGVNDDVRAQF